MAYGQSKNLFVHFSPHHLIMKVPPPALDLLELTKLGDLPAAATGKQRACAYLAYQWSKIVITLIRNR